MTTTARKLTARYRPLRAISVDDVERMHKLFSTIYENADVPTFLRDLSKKDGAILVRDKRTKEICGFTTIKKVPLWDGRRRAIGVFSGDTVLDPSCWGDRALKDAFTRHLLYLWLTSWGRPLYWLLISKGYKTYMLLVNNFVSYHPRPDGAVDPKLELLVRDYSEKLFPGKYDERRGVWASSRGWGRRSSASASPRPATPTSPRPSSGSAAARASSRRRRARATSRRAARARR